MNKKTNKLLDWYNQSNFSLPWRNSSDPYKIWISEIMLQQTQVQTVKNYYIKWVQVYPTVQSLSDSNIDSILKLWEGLGYYQRAHNLHKASQVIVASIILKFLIHTKT